MVPGSNWPNAVGPTDIRTTDIYIDHVCLDLVPTHEWMCAGGGGVGLNRKWGIGTTDNKH